MPELWEFARPELIEQKLRDVRFVARSLRVAIKAYVGAAIS